MMNRRMGKMPVSQRTCLMTRRLLTRIGCRGPDKSVNKPELSDCRVSLFDIADVVSGTPWSYILARLWVELGH